MTHSPVHPIAPGPAVNHVPAGTEPTSAQPEPGPTHLTGLTEGSGVGNERETEVSRSGGGSHRAPFQLTVRFGALTHTGLVREHNEDSYLASAPVFLVADGMGGHRAGDVASQAALAAFAPLCGEEIVTQEQLDAALAQAAQDVHALGTGVAAPGSTLSGLVLSRQDEMPCVRVVNIGDSRTYCLRDQRLRQITHDHSEVQEQVDAGLLTREQARLAEYRNVITRALGAGVGPHVSADQTLLPVHEDDRFLICSDGLSSLVTDTQLARTLHQYPDPTEAAQVLLGLALEAGGSDNITIIVVDVVAAHPRWNAARSLESTIPTRVTEETMDATVPRAELSEIVGTVGVGSPAEA